MTPTARPEWDGRIVVCIASGPSLTAKDCELVRASGHPTIVTNTTYRMAPWADVVFGMDLAWWKLHQKEIEQVCTGRRISTSHAARAYGAESLCLSKWFPNFGAGNSGMAAIRLALLGNADKAVLLGYDCQKTNGKMHWFGDHPKGLGNGASLKRWPQHFERLAKDAKRDGRVIVNASRTTALTCFDRVDLEDALQAENGLTPGNLVQWPSASAAP